MHEIINARGHGCAYLTAHSQEQLPARPWRRVLLRPTYLNLRHCHAGWCCGCCEQIGQPVQHDDQLRVDCARMCVVSWAVGTGLGCERELGGGTSSLVCESGVEREAVNMDRLGNCARLTAVAWLSTHTTTPVPS